LQSNKSYDLNESANRRTGWFYRIGRKKWKDGQVK